MIRIRPHQLRQRHPVLASEGLWVEHFPGFSAADTGAANVHDVLYLSLIVHGQAWHRVDDERWPEGPGGLSVVPYGVGHYIDTAGEPVDVWNIYLDPQRHPLPDLPPEQRAAIYRLLPLHPGLIHRRNRLTHVTLDAPDAAHALLAAIADEQRRDAPGRRDASAHLLAALLIAIARAVPEAPGAGDDERMEALRRDLDARSDEAVSVAALAADLGWSEAHLCRRFKRHVGCSILAYLRQRRLEAAMAALRTGDERVLDLALRVGFRDLAAFNRHFKALTGVTPSAYRARFRGA